MLSLKSREKKKLDQKEQKTAFARNWTRVWGVPPANTIHIRSYTVRNLKYGTGYTAYRRYGVYTVIRFGPTLHICAHAHTHTHTHTHTQHTHNTHTHSNNTFLSYTQGCCGRCCAAARHPRIFSRDHVRELGSKAWHVTRLPWNHSWRQAVLPHRSNAGVRLCCVCVCVCASLHACACVCACLYVCACLRMTIQDRGKSKPSLCAGTHHQAVAKSRVVQFNFWGARVW